MEEFWRNRRQLSKNNTVYAKFVFISDSNVTVNISKIKNKKKTTKPMEDKNKNWTNNHTEESSVDVDEDSNNTHCLASDSNDDSSIFYEEEDAIDDDELNKTKLPRNTCFQKVTKRELASIKGE